MDNVLRPVFHPYWGSVGCIREKEQATHVWQHLYNLRERWDALVGVSIQALWAAAEREGCPPPPSTPSRGGARPRLARVGKGCYALLKQHHDGHYGPAYLEELRQTLTVWEIQLRDPGSLLCCTPRGILVAVRLEVPRYVATAYRPDLPVDDPSAGDEDYHLEARRRWKMGTTMTGQPGSRRELLRELEDVCVLPLRRPMDAWRLVRVVGQARVIAREEPGIEAPLRAAEEALARQREQVARLLEGRLRTGPLLDALEWAVAAAEAEQVEDKLLALEDVLAVTEVLGWEAEVVRIQTRVGELLSAWPAALAGFDMVARARIEVSTPGARVLWSVVRDASSVAPGPLAASRGWLDGARAHIAENLGRVEHAAVRVMDELITGARLRYAGTLGDGAAPEFDVQVEGRCPAEWQLRLFVVDAAHPGGELLVEVDDYAREGDRWTFKRWRLHGERDDVLVIAITAPVLPATLELPSLLVQAAELPEVGIREVWLSPSSARTP